MADTLKLLEQGARSFPAIPEPTSDPASVLACASALKRAVEILIGLTSTFASLAALAGLGGDTTTGGVIDSGKMTQAQVLARISIGV